MRHLVLSSVLLLLAIPLLACADTVRAEPSPIDLDWLRRDCGDGALVHHADGRLYLTELATGESVFLAAGNQPEFSPDSSKIAWIDGTSALGRLRKGDPTTIHVIARGVEPSAGVHWLSDSAVAVVLARGRKAWYRVSLDGTRTELPELTRLGTGGYECDVRRGSDGVWSYVAKRTWRTSDGRRGTLPGTCSVSLSPDGKSVTSLHNPHKECTITAIRPGGIDSTLWWPYAGGFDNQRWSSNDRRYIVAVDEHHQTMVVMTPDGRHVTRMGTLGRAEHGMYGDFTVGDGTGDPWPAARRSAGVTPAEPRVRRPVPRLVVDAVLLHKRPIPRLEAYPETLVVYDYRVSRVETGDYRHDKLLVAHWGTRGGAVVFDVRGRAEGRTYRLVLEPFDAHPELHGLKIVENLEDLDLPLFHDADSAD